MVEEKRTGLGAPSIRDANATTIRSTRDVSTGGMDTVSVAFRDALAAAKSVGSSIGGAMTSVGLGADRSAPEVDSGQPQACNGNAVGVLLGSGDRGEASHRTFLHPAAMTGSDLTGAAAELIEGPLRSAKDIDVDPTRAGFCCRRSSPRRSRRSQVFRRGAGLVDHDGPISWSGDPIPPAVSSRGPDMSLVNFRTFVQNRGLLGRILDDVHLPSTL